MALNTSTSESQHLLPHHVKPSEATGRAIGGVNDPKGQVGNGYGSVEPKNLQEAFRRVSYQVSSFVSYHTGSIGYLGSISIAVNSLTGPAMLTLPATFERSGIIPTTCTLIFVCILSALCCMHMANTISKVPNNADFSKEVEFSQAFGFFWGKGWYMLTQVLFFGCITCLNISSIVDTAHVVDTVVGQWSSGTRGSIALRIQSNATLSTWNSLPSSLTSEWASWNPQHCSHAQLEQGDCLPFAGVGDGGVVLTLGTLLVTLFLLPLGLMDLKENSLVQIIGFVILLLTCTQFTVEFLTSGVYMSNASWWGDDWDDMLGIVLFNFALVLAIPAWLYEREPHVDVGTVIYGSSILSLVLYIVIGLLGDMAIKHISQNMLESMMSGSMGTPIQIGASIFAFANIGLGVPLFCCLTRLNLVGSGLCSPRVGNLLSVYFPFAVSWFLYDSTALTKMLSWGGIIFTGLVVFVLPLLLTIHVVSKFDYKGAVNVCFGFFSSKRAEFISLNVLLFLAIGSLVFAIVIRPLEPAIIGDKTD